jgi:hypothetical protein
MVWAHTNLGEHVSSVVVRLNQVALTFVADVKVRVSILHDKLL